MADTVCNEARPEAATSAPSVVVGLSDTAPLFVPGLRTPAAVDPATQQRLEALFASRCDVAKMLEYREQRRAAGWVHIALCVGYVGFPFFGLQLQTALPVESTVEGILMVAAHRAGLIDELWDGGRPGKQHQLTRSSRTDTGVHAVRNQITLLIRDPLWRQHGPEGLANLLNAELAKLVTVPWYCPLDGGTAAKPTPPPPKPTAPPAPACVVVHRVSRVSSDYVPRYATTRRVYRYLVPLFALDRKLDAYAEWAAPTAAAPSWASSPLPLRPNGLEATHGESLDAQSWDRIDVQSDEELGYLRAHFDALIAPLQVVLSKYVGRHRYHNFTGVEGPLGAGREKAPKIKPADNEASRVILQAGVVPAPLLIPTFIESDANGGSGGRVWALPYAVVQLEGTGFLLHMIRKMVGTAVAIARGANPELLTKALDPAVLLVTPMAPGNGLFLHQAHFDGYDARDAQQYPRLALDLALARSAIVAGFEEAVLLPCIAFREAWHCGVLPRAGRTPYVHPEASLEAAAPTGATSGVRPPSATTIFLRMLRMHNWDVRKSPYPLPSTKKKDRREAKLVLKQRAAEEAAASASTTVADAGNVVSGEPPAKSNRTEGADQAHDANNADVTAPAAPVAATVKRRTLLGTIVDSGWIPCSRCDGADGNTADDDDDDELDLGELGGEE